MRRQLGLADVLADTGANDDGGALAGPDASAHLDLRVSHWPVSSPTRAAPTPRAAVSDGAPASYLHRFSDRTAQGFTDAHSGYYLGSEDMETM